MTDRELLKRALDALVLACAICDAVPTREPGHLGTLVNAQPDGTHGYRVIHDACDSLRAALAAPQAPAPVPDLRHAKWLDPECADRGACQSLRFKQAALAAPQYTYGHCENKAQPGGCQMHNLQCGYPDCDRKLVAQPQAEHPEPSITYWEGDEMTSDDIKELRSWAAADRLAGLGELARLIDALLAERERLVTEKDALQDVYNSVFDESLRIAKERDALLAEVESLRKDLAGLESVRREQADGRDYWVKECAVPVVSGPRKARK